MNKLENAINNFNKIGLFDLLKGFSGVLIIYTTFLVIVLTVFILLALRDKSYVLKLLMIAIEFSAIIIFVLTPLLLSNKNEVQKERLKEIINIAKEEKASCDLIITDSEIIYKNASCSHDFIEMNELVQKNSNGEWEYLP